MPPKPQTQGQMLPSILGAASSLGGSIVQMFSQRASEKRTLEANRQLAEEAYRRDLDMWNKANEYNTPEAQMLRLKEAGLNPNLIYGNASAGGNAAQQMPKYQAPTAQYNALPIAEGLQGTISMYQDIQLKNAQIDNVRAQAEINQANARWQEFLASGRAVKSREGGKREALRASMEGNTYEFNDPKGKPTPWQQHQMQLLEQKARTGSLSYDKALAEIHKIRAGTAYQRMMTDWYSGKAIMGLLGTGAGIIKSLRGRTSAGRATPTEGMTKAQSKKLEEFKKQFIKNYER